MKPIVSIGLVAIAAMVAGCIPLEQAPLVYASRVQMGVGVTGGTAEAPGLDVTIGYKQIDAAFVPVAIAKSCRNGADCPNANYDIRVVEGGSKQTGLSQSDSDAAKRAREAMTAADAASDRISQAIAQDDGILAGLQKLGDKQIELAALTTIEQQAGVLDPQTGATAPTLTGDQVKRKAELEADIATLKAQQQQEQATRDHRSAQQALLARSTSDKNAAQADLDQILMRKDQRNDDVKSDAYSVYGSFNGNATGDSSGAALKLGKVFSTGIAAQFLSQGIRNSAVVDAMTKCLVEARGLVGTSTDDGVRAAALRSCILPAALQN